MKYPLSSALIIFVFAVFASGQIKYSTYTNERFAYSIEYPSDLLKMQAPPANGDGREFLSKDKSVRMLVWGEYNAAEKSFQERYEFDMKGFTEKPTYMVLKKNWFVLSGVKDGKIFYQKTLYRKTKNEETFFTFTIEYPKTKRAKFDPIVRRIAASFKFDPNADV